MNRDRLIGIFVKVLLEVLTPERVQKIINKSLDFVEETVQESKTEVDDMLVLPITKMIRSLINKG
jgi:hypothetical protein